MFLGNGDGTFGAPLSSPFNANGSLRVADFNKDGRPDLLFANQSGAASVAMGKGDGTFQSPAALSVPAPGVNGYALGDFNNDGNLDIVATFWTGVKVFFGNGDGSFQSPTEPSRLSIASTGSFVLAADFNGDGKLDIAVQGYPVLGFLIAFGNGDGTFSNGVSFNTGGAVGNIAVSDFNLDGKPDIAVPNARAGRSALSMCSSAASFPG